MADTEAPDALEMSDDDFMKMSPSAFDVADSSPPEEDTSPTPDTTEEDDAPEEEAQADDNRDAADEEGEDETEQSTNEEAQPKDTQDTEDAPDDKSKDPDVADKDNKPSGELTDAQFAAVGKQIMAEFKANGMPIKVKSAEDAIQLMQMGANYHKKMAGLKPSLKTLKLLENHGLLDPQKLNYLIDLSQKKPEAITQLLKDSNIDPMDIDLQGENDYVPDQRTVSDTEIVLDEVLESISTSPTYNRTLTVLGDEWDAASRDAIAKTPEIIRTINAHMENGIYEQVANAVAYDRSLGKLVGVSDFEAYQRTGSYMHENNMFKGATGQTRVEAQNQAKTQPAQKIVESAEQLRQRQDRKKAASPSRQKKAPVADNGNYNPLEMSDEEFIKLNKLNL